MNKILIIQTASIGDVILATPVLEKLHHYFPDAQIDFLLKKGTESLFEGHPFLHEVLIWDKRSHKFLNFDKLMHHIWYAKYDIIVNLQRFFLTGLMTAISRAGMRIGFDKNPLSFCFTKKIPHSIGSGIHEIKRNLSLISEITDDIAIMPRIYPSQSDLNHVATMKTGRYYTISPASLWFTKQYPLEKWVEFAKHISFDAAIYLLGASCDSDLCDSIIGQASHPGMKNIAGKLTFLQSAGLMKDAKMNFTNDSAPLHLASAVNAPVTAIYCSTVPEFGFGPLSDSSHVVQITEKLSCRPCGLHGYKACPEKHFKCAFDINSEQLSQYL
ncbi:MAG: glycosyltransferase family 9 protein [Bacteroidota bacterium]